MLGYILALIIWLGSNGYSIICEDGVGLLVYDSAGSFVGVL